MKRFFTYILALFLPVYLLVSLVWGNSVARNRPCKGLCVTVVDSAQAQYVSADEIRTYLEKYVPTDKKTILAEINTEEMEALLSENRLVEEVRCYKTPSGLLRVDISQRVPILRVLGDSAAYFLDEHGEMMPAGLARGRFCSGGYRPYIIGLCAGSPLSLCLFFTGKCFLAGTGRTDLCR